MRKFAFGVAATALLTAPGSAVAGEIFGGLYVHDVDTFLSKGGYEDGADLQIGWRGDRIRTLAGASPHAFVLVNSDGGTNFAVAGLGWKIGDPLYVRPGLGLAVHDGPELRVRGNRRVDLGSRIVFAPELAIGYRINEAVSLEASWVHFSHAQLFDRQNAGMDNIGLRLNYRFR